MKKFIAFILLINIFITNSYSQSKKNKNYYTISGFIKESRSLETLIGVNVFNTRKKVGTISNTYGFYSLSLPQDSVKLVFSYVGYPQQVFEFYLNKDTILDVELKPSLDLKEVIISGEKYQKISENSRMSVIEIPMKQVNAIPALFGEKDVLKVIQLMPGVQKGSEGSSGFYVRGGSPDQNLIILDDAPVYNAFHLFGFFSIFNGDAIKSLELTKGGFPAHYGGRLSSVLDMNMKDGNKENFGGECGIGIISSRLTVEGPIKKGKSSFLLSGRRTYIDLLIMPFLPKDSKVGYYFYDFNAKLNFDLDKKNRIFVSGYFGRDKFYTDFEKQNAGFYWQNATATARWNHLFSNKLFSNTSFILSKYDLVIYAENKVINDSGDEEFKANYNSGIRDIGIKYDIQYQHNPNHLFRFGLHTTNHLFTPVAYVISNKTTDISKSKKNTINSFETGLYIEDELKILSRTKMNVGVRLSHFYNNNKHYIQPEPRLSASYILKEDLSVKISYVQMNQFVHLLSPTGIGLPTDLWVPSTNKTPPQHNQQIAAGLAKDFNKPELSISIEGYYKTTQNALSYKEGASFLKTGSPEESDNYSWEENLTFGKGLSYGVELLIQKKTGRFSGWIGYTLSWTKLKFDNLNFGKEFYARYDRRHDVSIVGIYKISDNVDFSATWVYGTGNAISLPLTSYTAYTDNFMDYSKNYNFSNNIGADYFNNYSVKYYGKKNNFRMAPYHRMDISLQFHKKISWGIRTIDLSIYNVYNRQNPYFYYTDVDKLMQVSLFPIIPSITYSVKF